ncbi:hypothetical protein L211DRAFT_848652 [Terfezia boudieri ATCC MYA-4762]|uniref:RING-type E3 ubiquitin transferase n=1 Tax=Terfezia boudieri ATCC MYA-4762 TaxID=1051890 RepID=A0A3N4LPS7_9PEZI|nr:hypothetical protein L211DRAFT_848652 [Terfezia boudieri ATCC MYA-4762]
MPQSFRQGRAPLASGTPTRQTHGHQSTIASNRDKEDSSSSHSKRTVDSTAPSNSSSIATLPERRKDKPPGQVPCRYFNAGFCARANECSYSHDLEKVRLQKVQLKIVLKSREDTRLREEAPEKDPLLPKEYMVPGRHQKALSHWRNDYWESKILQARAHQSQQAKDNEERKSERSKINKDVKRLQNKIDPVGESSRKLTEAKKQRKTVFVKGNSEGVPIPLEAEGCPICQDEPRAIKVYGLMKNCNHVFCYDCIIGWRKTNVTNKNCPICRTRSPFILKSSVYPYTPGVILEDNNKPADGPKAAPESNKPVSGSKPKAQGVDVEDGTTGLAYSNDIGTDTTDRGKMWIGTKSSMGSDDAGDSKLLLDTNVIRNSNTLVNASITSQSASICPANHDKHSSDEDCEHGSAPGTSALQLSISDHEVLRKKRSRRKPIGDPDDPNPAKTLLLKNFLQKCKTTPCRYFCSPKNAKSVTLDHSCAHTQSNLWGAQNVGQKDDNGWGDISSKERRIPYCKYGNNCNFAHPHPEKPDEEYKYDDWERRVLGFARIRKRRGHNNQDVEDGEDVFAMNIASLPF